MLTATGAPALLIDAWLRGDFEVVTCSTLLDELADVLARPRIARRVQPEAAQDFYGLVARTAIVVDDPPGIESYTTDPKDDIVVAVARAASCAAIISGDAHLTALPDADPPVLTPRSFLDLLERG